KMVRVMMLAPFLILLSAWLARDKAHRRQHSGATKITIPWFAVGFVLVARLNSMVTGLPPAFVAVAEFDPLRDDGERYGAALRAAGGEAGFYPGSGLVHGCLRAHGIDEVEALHGPPQGLVQ
ncbi:putative sulfate exporter family transporter, partial [Pseudomonas aeruginosa]